ncbi:glycosyltransferase [Paenibacillus sp. FSL K6-1096]|uniref:glycosyltransferase family A protein n=1 Tax=Paenibacillus sp. FSL K6-1096 TaxID=2921460 RepID=UPI0030EEA97A
MYNGVSVIIPTYNKKERLKYTLDSLNNQVLVDPTHIEIIIVDDGSSDGTQELINQFNFKYPVKYIYQINTGRSSARNVGIRNAEFSVLLFCDDDMLMPGNFVANHLSIQNTCRKPTLVHGEIYNLSLLKFFQDPGTGYLFDKLITHSNLEKVKEYLLVNNYEENLRIAVTQKKTTLFEKQIQEIFNKCLSSLYWLCCTGGNISCSYGSLDDLYFDEDLDKCWGCEDLELGYRLHLANYDFIYSHDAFSFHIDHYRKNYKDNLEKAFEMFYSKHKLELVKKLPKLLLGEIREIDEFIEHL